MKAFWLQIFLLGFTLAQHFLNENNNHLKKESTPARKYQPESYDNLTYYLIPHSHTDAGWWLTFDIYYHSRAK